MNFESEILRLQKQYADANAKAEQRLKELKAVELGKGDRIKKLEAENSQLKERLRLAHAVALPAESLMVALYYDHKAPSEYSTWHIMCDAIKAWRKVPT